MRRIRSVVPLLAVTAIVGLVGLMSASAVASSKAGHRGHHGPPPPPHPHEVVVDHAQDWAVDETTVVALTSLLEEAEPGLRRLHESIDSAQTHTERFDLHQEMHDYRSDMMVDVRALLTTDQFELLLGEMHPKRGHGPRRRH